MKNFDQKLRFVARWSRALPVALVFWAAPALARPDFPEAIQNQLGLDCPPPCWLCHASAAGGGPTDKPFPIAMLKNGLKPNDPESAKTAAQTILDAGAAVDSDGDGVNDSQELKDQRNPNINGNDENDTLACPPEYGCGARVAPTAPMDGTAMASAIATAAVLVAFGRRRRR
jgi:hypothetical protein